MSATKEDLAKAIDGIDYSSRNFFADMRGHAEVAKQNGLVIVYGQSDDLMMLAGAITAQAYCYEGGVVRIDQQGALRDWQSVLESGDKVDITNWITREPLTKSITAVWAPPGRDLSWEYQTEIEHAKFVIREFGDDYCIGIVFDIASLPKTP